MMQICTGFCVYLCQAIPMWVGAEINFELSLGAYLAHENGTDYLPGRVRTHNIDLKIELAVEVSYLPRKLLISQDRSNRDIDLEIDFTTSISRSI